MPYRNKSLALPIVPRASAPARPSLRPESPTSVAASDVGPLPSLESLGADPARWLSGDDVIDALIASLDEPLDGSPVSVFCSSPSRLHH